MKSIINLFYKSLVHQGKNFILDNEDGNQTIESYLATLQSIEIDDFQYIKHQLSLSIKVNMNQTNLEMIDSKDLNYVKIQNFTDTANEKPYYYFVINKIWRSKETIEIVLSMDTLNTFKFNSDYNLSSKTLVKRMHKDRFEVNYDNIVGTSSIVVPTSVLSNRTIQDIFIGENIKTSDFSITNITIDGYTSDEYFALIAISPYDESRQAVDIVIRFTTIHTPLVRVNVSYVVSRRYFFRMIDLKSEDISCPVYKTREDILQESSIGVEWSLYYKSRESGDNQPIDCYLVSNQPLKYTSPSTSRLIDVSLIPSNQIILITSTYQGNLTFKIDSNTYTIRQETEYETYEVYDIFYAIGFKNDNGVLKVYKYTFQKDQASPTIAKVYEQDVGNAVVEFTGSQDTIQGYQTASITNYTNNFPTPNFTFTFSSSTLISLNTRDDINRTLSENLKIINIPYCPSDVSFVNDVITISPLWTYDTTYKFLRLTDLNSRFKHTIETSVNDILSYFNVSLERIIGVSRFVVDSKLYHSDYFRPKFVYDSFSKVFPLEQINYQESYALINSNHFKFTFVMTRNIVSKFLFKFSYVYKYSTEDYDNVVAVARNNEEVLYTSSYLNYVRTGYNYDLKSKERQQQATGATIGLSAFGLVASSIAGIATGNPIAVGSAIASGISLASSLINYAKTTSQSEENIQRKLQETQRQAVSVSNADDSDLLYEYTQNKAKLCIYEVSENMNNVLNDLFYYCGYIVNEQMIPETNTRYWFNFVQCELVLNDTSNLSNEIEDDIKEKFNQGVTFLHYHNAIFDFEQNMENWETSIL